MLEVSALIKDRSPFVSVHSPFVRKGEAYPDDVEKVTKVLNFGCIDEAVVNLGTSVDKLTPMFASLKGNNGVVRAWA